MKIKTYKKFLTLLTAFLIGASLILINPWEAKAKGVKHRIRSSQVKKKKSSSRKNKFKYYKVKKGDTLYRLSKNFKVPINSITKLNRLSHKNKIKYGQVLKIPLKKNKKYKKKKYCSQPKFKWPLKKIYSYKRDSLKGVKPIGLLITSRSGSPVYSSAQGTVSKIGNMRGFGNYVIIKHKNKYLTIYSNLDKILVAKGKKISKGSLIGKLGRSNNCLHFQIGYSGEPKNPLNFLPHKS